jgi:thioredoxin-like negative regulator of GroEL
MEVSHQQAERFYLKLFFGSALGIILLIAVIWGGRDLYARWQERRLVRRALSAMQQGDDNAASLAARTVLELKPSSAPAARVMAELGEKTGNRVALDWRRKAVQFAPHSVDDALALARCALQFGNVEMARDALSNIPEEGKERGGYHATLAMIAQREGQDEKAEAEWTKAIQLEPEEKGYQLQLGILRLRAKEEEKRAAGRTMLFALRDDPKQRAAATRALIGDGASRHENSQKLLELARELQAYPEATVTDRLTLLDFLHQAQAPQFTAYLTEVENNVLAKPTDLAALIEWMSQSNLNLVAIDFLKNVPSENLEKWPVPVATADLYARLKDWHKLENITKDANWREAEFMRHAYLARALRGQDKSAAAEREWAVAVKETSGQGASLLSLVRATSEWNWEKEMLDLLWTLTRDPDKQNEAIQMLYGYYARTDDTQGLYRTLVRWSELAPDDLNIQNNFAQVSLLLDANPQEARRIAAEVYRKEPSNAAYATTYAYSLLSKGNVNAAAKLMSSLTPEQLHDPAISAYYGICLAAVHDEKAREFLEAGRKAKLLPEEKKLVDKALADLHTSPTGD